MKRINLALQGGGSHGAYSWGALDALLDDERLADVVLLMLSAQQQREVRNRLWGQNGRPL